MNRHTFEPREDRAKVRIFGHVVTIHSNSQIVGLPNDSVLVIPPPLAAGITGAPTAAIQYWANGEQRAHPELAR
jgi:hypothetical protein